MKKILLGTAAALVLSTPAFAVQSFDARSVAMGGIGVSTADKLTAPFHNPALAARYKGEGNMELLIPAFGISLLDNDDIIDQIDDVADAIDAFIDNPSQSTAPNVVNRLTDLQGDTATAQSSIGLAIAIPTQFVSINVYSQAYVDVTAFSDIDPDDLAIDVNSPNPNYIFDSSAAVSGIGVLEFGVTLAKEYKFTEGVLYYGLTPKVQQINTINYVANIHTFEGSDFDSDEYMDDETAFNLDAGVAYVYKGFSFGLMGKNLISQDYETVTSGGLNAVYALNPVFTSSVSYSTDFFTIGVDVDLNESERFERMPILNIPVDADSDNMQMAGIGVEINALDWIQVRAGYQSDIANNLNDQFTAGVGFHIFETVALDLAGTYGGSNELGGALQLSFMF